MFIGEQMSTTTLAVSLKEQLAPVVERELAVINEGATTFGIGKAKGIFTTYADATFDDVYSNLTKQTPASAAAVISGLISARSGVPISFLVPAQMQEDLGNEYLNIEVSNDQATMFGRLHTLKVSEADKRERARLAGIADGTIAQAKATALVKSFAKQKAEGVRYTEEQKAAILAAM
jgi:hypothetical protein